MHLRVLHRTTFHYDGFAHESFNEVRLRPLDDATQRCLEFALETDPAATLREYPDFYGNAVHYFEVPGKHGGLAITATSVVETALPAARPTPPAVTAAELEAAPDREMFAEFYTASHYVPLEVELWREAQDALAAGRADVWSDVRQLGGHVFRTFTYRGGTTGVSTLATDALRQRTGVCQDYAHVQLGLCRSLGIPARYVSGYFLNTTRRPDEPEASHAWIEVWLPGPGWIGFDPTHNRVPDERYVKLAVGRDYADVSPIRGTYRGLPSRRMEIDVAVREAAAAPA